MSVSFVAGQLPPVFIVCLIISLPWLRHFLHLNIKWATVCSSSSQGHIGLTVGPSLYKYDLIFSCPVVRFNSENIGIFCVTLFLIDGKKAFVNAPFSYPSTAVPTYEVRCLFLLLSSPLLVSCPIQLVHLPQQLHLPVYPPTHSPLSPRVLSCSLNAQSTLNVTMQ